MNATVLAWLGVVAASVTAYNLAQKILPREVSPFVVLLAIYLVGALLCTGVLAATGAARDPALLARSALHPSILLLALSVMGIELGYLLAYRAGLSLNVGPLVSTAAATAALAVLGATLFGETLSARQIAGIVVVLAGLALVVSG